MGGSGRASGPGPLLQAAPPLSAALGLTGLPGPGLKAATASGVRLEGSGAAWAGPGVEAEVEAGFELGGKRSVVGEQPPEEAAVAEWWLLELRSEQMMQTCR